MTRPESRPVLEHVGRQLRGLRRARGWSAVDAAAAIQCSRVALLSWEAGSRDPGLDTLARVAGVYGLRVGDLFPDTAPMPVPARHRVLAALTVLRDFADEHAPAADVPGGGASGE